MAPPSGPCTYMPGTSRYCLVERIEKRFSTAESDFRKLRHAAPSSINQSVQLTGRTRHSSTSDFTRRATHPSTTQTRNLTVEGAARQPLTPTPRLNSEPVTESAVETSPIIYGIPLQTHHHRQPGRPVGTGPDRPGLHRHRTRPVVVWRHHLPARRCRLVASGHGHRHRPRRLVGQHHMRAELVPDAVVTARDGRVDGITFHSDRGAQYGSGDYPDACRRHGIRRSMGRIGSSLLTG